MGASISLGALVFWSFCVVLQSRRRPWLDEKKPRVSWSLNLTFSPYYYLLLSINGVPKEPNPRKFKLGVCTAEDLPEADDY